MTHNTTSPQFDIDEILAAAVDRAEAGEPIATIISSYPDEYAEEMTEFLAIADVAAQFRTVEVPRPAVEKRAAAKASFLQAAAQMRQEYEAEQLVAAANIPMAIASTPALKPTSTNRAVKQEHWGQRLLNGLQAIFSTRAMRLAPMIALLAFLFLSASSLVTLAQASVPGDLTYSIKQWMRRQELQFAPEEQRALVRMEQEREIAEDVRKAAAKADHNAAVIQVEDTLVYYGRTGRLLKLGGLSVMDRYQPDANIERFKPIVIDGELAPGVQVALNYQIMPGQSNTVQGVALTVLTEAPMVDTTTEGEPAEGLSDPEVTSGLLCEASVPEAWTPYEVQSGDTLLWLAKRGETTVEDIKTANCLESDIIRLGFPIFLPPQVSDPDHTVRRCDVPLPESWDAYTVRSGDSLSVLAKLGETTVDELMSVNCFQDDTILIDSVIYVPEAVLEARDE